MRSLTRLAGVGSAGLVLAVLAGCSSSGPDPSSPTSPVGSADATGSPRTPAGTTATATLSASDRIAQWFAGVQADFSAIQSDTESIKAAAQANQASALPNLCAALRSHVVAVNNDPAPPDKRIAVAVSGAMSAYGSAASSCLAGNYTAAATGINQGAALLQQANDIISTLPGAG